MLEHIFLKVLQMSVTASVVIGAVFLIRFLLHRAPKIFSYMLWSAVLFRLLCPFSFSSVCSVFSVFGENVSEPAAIEHIIQAELLQTRRVTHDVSQKTITEKDSVRSHGVSPASTPINILTYAKWIWLVGALVSCAYSMMKMFRFSARLKGAVKKKENIYISGKIDTPFVIGILRPAIYLPDFLKENEAEYIILHEQTHIRRKDYWFRFLGFLALCIHWFNPLVWAAFFYSEKDMEMSCDEAVIRKMGKDIKKEYSSSLLNLATRNHVMGRIPLGFGEGDTKGRVRNVLRYKKTALGFIIGTVILVMATIFVLITNPKTTEENEQKEKTLAEQLYEAKNPYVGDHLANGKLTQILEIFHEIGDFKTTLQQKKEPYVTEQSNREVERGEKANIGTYSLLSSSVPGYPLNTNHKEQKNNKQNIKIDIETDGGTLVSWNSKTGKVKDLGKNVSFELNKNIYWSPLCNNTIDKKANVKIVTYEGNKVVKETLLYIYEEQEANYVIQEVSPSVRTEATVDTRQQKVQEVLEQYFADFFATQLEDSDADYSKDDFASINGYIIAKNLVNTRNTYNTSLGGIHEIALKEVTIEELSNQGNTIEAAVYTNYTFSYGDNEKSTTGCLYHVTLEMSGDQYKVTDLDNTAVETRMIKERLKDTVANSVTDPYSIVDSYYEEIQKKAENMQ